MRKILTAYIVIIAALLPALTISVGAADADNPRLVMLSYALNEGESETVVPGMFTLNYTLLNTSSFDLVNTILTYDQKSESIIPVPGRANVEYIGRIGAGREFGGAVELYVPKDIPSGQRRLDIVLSYNVADPSVRSQLSSTISIYINISNNPELNIKRVELSDETSGGNRRTLYIEYENPGTIGFKNLQLFIEGNIDEQQKISSPPILNAGRSSSVEYSVQFTRRGIQDIYVYMTYEDDVGNSYQTPVITRRANIEDSDVVPDSAPDVPQKAGYLSMLISSLRGNMKNPAFLATLFVSVAAIVGIAFVAARSHKRSIRKNWYYKNSTGGSGDKKNRNKK